MKLVQRQATQQRLALSQHMRNSLSLLQMSSDDALQALNHECCRNPFIKHNVPTGTSLSAASNDEGQVGRDFAVEESNTDALINQISLINMPDNERELACQLTYCLDDRGFFTESSEEISKYINVSPRAITAVVEKLQASIEPTGAFAWSLQDCFKIQLEAKNRYDPLIAELLKHLDLIAANDVAGICKIVGGDEEDAEDMLSDIRALSPSPLSRQHSFNEIYQNADLILSCPSDDKIEVRLNEAAFPTLLADDALFSTITTAETDQASRTYYHDCYRTAGAFVLAMQKRANTLLRIGKEIAKVQDRFIRNGRSLDRKPLTMGSISKLLGLNKSTVSRALNGCLIETPQGLKPADEFIVRPLTDGQNQKTREHALRRLSVLIKTENRKHPYSDEVLADLMSKVNLNISRRTIAKYRSILEIPNAFRRREK